MEPWPRLPLKTYNFNFRNLREAPNRNSTYLCFEVEEEQPDSPESYYWGIFRNQQPSHLQHSYLEEPLHAERCFLSWFNDTILSPRADYHVTWYMSWSPCFECAEEVVEFLGEHENVSLNISASRLYKCEDEDQQQGLQLLDQAGAQVAMMSPEDFKYCWDNFVDNRGRSFRYWKGVHRNYCALDEKLKEILCSGGWTFTVTVSAGRLLPWPVSLAAEGRPLPLPSYGLSTMADCWFRPPGPCPNCAHSRRCAPGITPPPHTLPLWILSRITPGGHWWRCLLGIAMEKKQKKSGGEFTLTLNKRYSNSDRAPEDGGERHTAAPMRTTHP